MTMDSSKIVTEGAVMIIKIDKEKRVDEIAKRKKYIYKLLFTKRSIVLEQCHNFEHSKRIELTDNDLKVRLVAYYITMKPLT